jgi:hypothetical protein
MPGVSSRRRGDRHLAPGVDACPPRTAWTATSRPADVAPRVTAPGPRGGTAVTLPAPTVRVELRPQAYRIRHRLRRYDNGAPPSRQRDSIVPTRATCAGLDDQLARAGFISSAHLRRRQPTAGVTLRGLCGLGRRTLVVADDVPVNDPFGGWVYWVDALPGSARAAGGCGRGAPAIRTAATRAEGAKRSRWHGGTACGAGLDGGPARNRARLRPRHDPPNATWMAGAYAETRMTTDGFPG